MARVKADNATEETAATPEADATVDETPEPAAAPEPVQEPDLGQTEAGNYARLAADEKPTVRPESEDR